MCDYSEIMVHRIGPSRAANECPNNKRDLKLMQQYHCRLTGRHPAARNRER